ncbi:MAG: hypothetical protein A2408_02080 [Candidatus Yonathbacteria bacterium RIFOXYC1_FULL_52_10]|uniref:Response regulatory domain-containing protein n=1 Tax=Candidatus Yonathbacteria bacterium RIFOXYD1_FULL_52_36 TaxID=1802730 RepID=A0A1G2SLV2_9BACT|nr:MAG: hypothetical protein A2408_02080 [Candidatus Yonathbacteria bacterium RIFOXYC1_FULL_52_10]OHA86040.1 MAG: hypothetical protein A2591_01450 [Candidatus Yonathbacteria bacterium RIFOXYD1_FULL_52_36]
MKKILIVDDDKIFAKILRDGLGVERKDVYEVTAVHDGEEGLAKIQELKPDLVVLDIMLPKITGIEILEKLKEEGVSTPVLMSTQIADLEKISRVVELGAKGYIIKSDYSLEHIIRQIDEILK